MAGVTVLYQKAKLALISPENSFYFFAHGVGSSGTSLTDSNIPLLAFTLDAYMPHNSLIET